MAFQKKKIISLFKNNGSCGDGAHHEGPGSESSLVHQTFASPDINSDHLMLSISTIASAIADASISTDPSQLAAMIIELSKKGRTRHSHNSLGPENNVSEEAPQDEHVRSFFWFVSVLSELLNFFLAFLALNQMWVKVPMLYPFSDL